MYKKIALLLALMCMLVVTAFAANKRFTLVIDPGHGGHDAGARGAMSKEKDVNLTVALRFGKYVEQNMPEVRVIYTRTQDKFVPLHERANIANRANADLFISVHTNALPAGKVARGFEIYTLGMHRAKDNLDVAMRENSVISMEKGFEQAYEGFDPKSSESYIIFEFIQGKNMERSVDLARMIQRSVCEGAGRPNKGVHQAGFLVLRETSMPGCLIELGFITTPDEERLLNDKNKVDDIAKGIYEAFSNYKNKYDKSVSVPYRASERRVSAVPTVVPDSYKEKETAPAKLIPAKKIAPVAKKMEVAKKEGSSRNADSVRKVGSSIKVDSSKKAEKEKEETPVFKLQIFVGDRMLRKGDSHFKGEMEFDSFKEGSLVKYTIGSSTNYNEIYRLRKEKLDKFPEAFIIAFKNGEKYDVNQAIREFRQNRNK